ncbi:hypothetical protein [Clostridium beijerinckii]|uniref:Uncharacterized protein n=1 Tax=Clostridium beijerinckii TaxID=1520 RepID=A0AAX0B9F5_CLOBE|nr:hypothetical protein [Clostridium beijerinckii]NOW05392.1 hypothetical protein [Clostridium beijerinckii]NRT92072.1 hypothetical protein [Clostridium beijerinckii]NYC01465.1 hypothetical protein [Clostridium beijerinckii]NYC71599.1 hypothetical protein [Clostridium beijerinckii]
MKLNKKIIASIACAMTLMTAFPAFATTTASGITTKSKTLDINNIDIDKLSKDNNVDPNELRASIEKSLKSHRFSPFSGVKVKNNAKQTSSKKVNNDIKLDDYHGYCSQYNQNSTAYTDTQTASGNSPYIGIVAVHHDSSGTPYIPFGTKIYYSNSVSIQGDDYNSFDVEDTGDPNFVQSDYWTDIYFGQPTYDNEQAALNYGNNLVDYHYWL